MCNSFSGGPASGEIDSPRVPELADYRGVSPARRDEPLTSVRLNRIRESHTDLRRPSGRFFLLVVLFVVLALRALRKSDLPQPPVTAADDFLNRKAIKKICRERPSTNFATQFSDLTEIAASLLVGLFSLRSRRECWEKAPDLNPVRATDEFLHRAAIKKFCRERPSTKFATQP